MSRCTYFRYHSVCDQDARAGTHSLNRITKNRKGDVVGPVMEDAAEVVD